MTLLDLESIMLASDCKILLVTVGTVEVVVLFELMYDKLSVDGLIFIGDIPDIQYRSNYLIQSGKQEIYFDSVKRNEPLIGTWFDKGSLELLANRVGFRKIRVITQDPIMIYSDFRFDLMLNK